MGVPSFFRWLLEKYPRVVEYVKEEFVQYDVDGNRILPDSAGPNPNGIEFDNLYLDMNGIIHPCCHPEGAPQPKSEEEMIENIFKYIEHIFSMVRPRKILYLAIDGVAPRAKMNQQRARRFRAAQERLEYQSNRNKLERYYKSKGMQVPPPKPASWDHNVITPGTPFMDKLAKCLRRWLNVKLHSDSGWKGIKVILSDANIPGEGEHKIAQFIRRCRAVQGHDPNTRHVLYGLDADLFMLGLATHEPYFTILREEVLFGKNKPCGKCGVKGHWQDKCPNPNANAENTVKTVKLKPFVFAHLTVLREYLNYELKDGISGDIYWWDLENAIDDFVFLCFFVGNDFLPHLPSLDIREGALDNLLKYWKNLLPEFGGYLTQNGGKINLKRVSVLLLKLGDIEDEVFQKRTESDKQRQTRNENRENQAKKEQIWKKKQKKKHNQPPSQKRHKINDNNQNYNNKWQEMQNIDLANSKLDDMYDDDEVEFLEFFDEYDLKIDAHFMEMDFEHQLNKINRTSQNVSKCKKKNKDSNNESDLTHLIGFGTKGFKQRYYRQKLHVNYDENPVVLQKLYFEYVRGLAWVLLYYYQGCVSWSWFYPFHYAPFASDLKNVEKYENEFNFKAIKSKPFPPYAQLMAVLPAVSGKIALPKEYSDLMTAPKSAIIDFYPTDFKLDLNGKMFNWQAVVILPFVDSDRLLKTIGPLHNGLTPEQKRQNGVGNTLVYVNRSNPLSRALMSLTASYADSPFDLKRIIIDSTHSQGMNGYIAADPEHNIYSQNCHVCSGIYTLPKPSLHQCKILRGITLPPCVLDQLDFDNMQKPRFGKPRTNKYNRKRDTHFNYNRGWDQNIGYSQGKWKAKKQGHTQYQLYHQQTRQEYNEQRQQYNQYKPVTNFPKYEPFPNQFEHTSRARQYRPNKQHQNNNNNYYDNNNQYGQAHYTQTPYAQPQYYQQPNQNYYNQNNIPTNQNNNYYGNQGQYSQNNNNTRYDNNNSSNNSGYYY